jgi:hypothetical protein
MTQSSTLAAASSNVPADASSTRLFRYNTRVEFPLKESISNAPVLLQKLLTTLVGHSPGMMFYTADDVRIDTEDFPKAKHDFDRVFTTTVTEERNQRIVVGFEIRSELTFRKIKTAIWNFLLKHHIFIKKHPGPLQKMDLISVGWLHKAHPSYTSHLNVRSEINSAIIKKLSTLTAEERSTIPNASDVVPDMFFSPGRLKGVYDSAEIDSNVLFIQAERPKANLLRSLLELAFVETEHMSYIPSALKRDDPTLFGHYLCLQNEFLENHRNISIAGISPEAMDYSQLYNSQADETDDPETLWNYLNTKTGVIRIDSCRRTPDLGKWNVSTTKADYLQVTKWFDEYLLSTYNSLPAAVQYTCEYADFPTPRRFSRNTTPPSRSQAHQKTAYARVLASRITNTTPATVVRTAWRPHQPVVEVSYAFNENEFPAMKKPDTDIRSTATTSHLSSISEQAIQNAINAETNKLKAASQLREAAIDVRILHIETTLNNLTANIVSQIYAKMSGPDSPFVTVSHLDSKLDCLSQQIAQLCIASNTQTRTIESPPRKLTRLSGPEETIMAVDDEPPGPGSPVVDPNYS